VTADDRQLLLATHRGHEASARLLWSRHGQRLLAHARTILREPGAAEDAVQAVMCRLLELPRSRLAAIDDVGAFFAAATRREALNHLRASRRERARRETAPGPPRAEPDAAPGLPTNIHAALDTLPRRLREVVVLKHISGLTFDQIALALAANRNTIAGRYRSALAALRDLLVPAEGVAHG
jgi:RNA polymerase sigma-70 factor, ECF subfamily